MPLGWWVRSSWVYEYRHDDTEVPIGEGLFVKVVKRLAVARVFRSAEGESELGDLRMRSQSELQVGQKGGVQAYLW